MRKIVSFIVKSKLLCSKYNQMITYGQLFISIFFIFSIGGTMIQNYWHCSFGGMVDQLPCVNECKNGGGVNYWLYIRARIY